jgi:hypothetical protein
MAQMFCVDYPNYRVIGPRSIAKHITLPSIMKIDDFADSLLKTEVFADMVDNENIKLVILGSVYRASKVGDRTTYEIAIVDAQSKTVVKQLTTSWKLDRKYTEEAGQKQTAQYVSYQCNKVYKAIMKNAKREIENILQKE